MSIVVHKDAGDITKVKKLEKVNDDACVAVQTRSEAKKEEKDKQKLDETRSTNAKVEGIWCSGEKFIEYQERADSLQSIRDMAQNGPHEGKSCFVMKYDLLYRVFVQNPGEDLLQIVAP